MEGKARFYHSRLARPAMSPRRAPSRCSARSTYHTVAYMPRLALACHLSQDILARSCDTRNRSPEAGTGSSPRVAPVRRLRTSCICTLRRTCSETFV